MRRKLTGRSTNVGASPSPAGIAAERHTVDRPASPSRQSRENEMPEDRISESEQGADAGRRIASRKARLLRAWHKLIPRGNEKTLTAGKPQKALVEGRVSNYG